ncbi:SOU1 Sorbose reductase SOU1 [Candida maltosa Xu316]|uniref:Sorbose reductase SOU1 n=1 Tax=Candida maltosa (strain Xu316) TaxID=1245528 RepID=M3JVS2_CANMX|nr:Sorbose reductase SOU1 [Candida maltosa Xu316]
MSDQVISFTNAALGPLPTKPPTLPTNVLDLFSLKGKVASVTGSSGGIGWAVAEAYAQAGADVAIWYNSKPADDKAEYLSKTYGVKSKAYQCNVIDPKSVEQVIGQIEKDFGTIDIFVANAGVAWTDGPEVDVEGYDKWKKIIDCDLNGVYYCAHTVGQIFKKKGSGSLIITSSMSGTIVNVPQLQAPYNAAKAACTHLARSLAVEWASFGARVNAVSPGYIATDIAEFADIEMKKKWWQLTPLGREGLPQELVGAYLYLASNASTFTTGSNMAVDGGYVCP